MRQGMRLQEGERLAPVEVEAIPDANGGTLMRMTLRQGVNRQIRRMCRDLGLTILRLRRVELGPLQLGDLESGKWRPLTPAEILTLKSSLGLG
jgi:23S rRNA pseudouridine2605 synthase